MSNTSIKKAAPGQQGFTLIEIIAVLVILGILAAVAVPRYVDMQTEAANKAKEGACASVASNVNMQFSKALLNGNGTSDAINYATEGDGWISDLGDWSIESSPTDPGTTDESFTVTLNAPDGINPDNSTCTIANPAYDPSEG